MLACVSPTLNFSTFSILPPDLVYDGDDRHTQRKPIYQTHYNPTVPPYLLYFIQNTYTSFFFPRITPAERGRPIPNRAQLGRWSDRSFLSSSSFVRSLGTTTQSAVHFFSINQAIVLCSDACLSRLLLAVGKVSGDESFIFWFCVWRNANWLGLLQSRRISSPFIVGCNVNGFNLFPFQLRWKTIENIRSSRQTLEKGVVK